MGFLVNFSKAIFILFAVGNDENGFNGQKECKQ
jgi:hypothetical protein